jgi:hypothetical protein
MTLALFPLESFFAALPQLFTRRAVRRAPGLATALRTAKPRASAEHPTQVAIEFIASPAVNSWATAPKALKTRSNTPLRVLRVVEAGDRATGAGGAGRMRMSGSMADVCAELDRLAERESRQLSRLH